MQDYDCEEKTTSSRDVSSLIGEINSISPSSRLSYQVSCAEVTMLLISCTSGCVTCRWGERKVPCNQDMPLTVGRLD